MGKSFNLLVAFTFFGINVSAQLNPIVKTSLGNIKGTTLKTETGKEFYAFRGIRYAEAPFGEKRFKAPIAVNQSWDGEYDATRDGYMCPQIGHSVDLLSEDCLVLNVYTRNLTADLPVIVYIHGGSNKEGGSHSELEAGPQYLMEANIVLVSMNYRLGALGFLSTRTADAPGNFGYLDQLMALQWVQQHVDRFGGDPKLVTLMGFSAGGMAVTLHVVSPLSRGLFHRAIAMSGSVTHEQAIDNLHWTRKLAHETSCPMFNPEDMLSCLRKLPWQTIVEVSNRWDVYNITGIKLNYEVDGNFLEQNPSHYFAKGNFAQVPILTGLSRDEFNFMAKTYKNNPALLNDVNLNLDKYAREFFMHDFGASSSKKLDKFKNFYFKNDSINESNLEIFGEAHSDARINHSVHRLVDLARKYVDVFYYRFDYVGRFGQVPNVTDIFHGTDQFYVFKIKKFGVDLIGVKDREWSMVQKMVGIISTFAQTGKPPDFDDLKWQPSNKINVTTLYINETFKMDKRPHRERLQLWDEMFPVESSGSRSIYVPSLLIMVAVVYSLTI